MADRLIKTVELKNGLHLELIDASQKVAGDRWQVVLTARINIPVRMLQKDDSGQAELNVEEIVSSLGENVCFKQKRERNFISQNQKDRVLNDLTDSFVRHSSDYVASPAFPKRYVLRQYKEHLKRKSWCPN